MSIYKSRTHMATESKYKKIRQEVIDAANNLVPIQFRPAVSYSLITRKALIEHRSWHGVTGRRVNWDWERDD